VSVRRLLAEGETFVYAYYDGLDKVAHEHGLGDFYRQELGAVDRLVADLLEVLPPGAVLAVTSDHGQVEVGNATRMPDPGLFDMVELLSGEGRFRWLHVRPGSLDDAVAVAEEAHGDEAWVVTRQQMVEDGWFGGPLRADFARRLGDVALVAHAPVAFLDPADTGETRLMSRHGSLTAAEVAVPFVAFAPG
jgi:predicted AlkP superfamily pyrophosphatase or phosphodiesterase